MSIAVLINCVLILLVLEICNLRISEGVSVLHNHPINIAGR